MTKTEAIKRRKRLAPYASASALSQFFDHIRYVKTPDMVTSGLLGDYNISGGQAFALLSTLKFLGIIEDNGVPTPAYKLLQTSGEEFKANLEEIVRRAYSDLFSVVDPARNGRDHIKNFFARNYSPATAERATALFLDLCGEAGIPTLEEKTPKVVKEKPTRSRLKPIMSTTDTIGKTEIGFTDAAGVQKRPGIDIKIDSKDFASMQPDQIQAFFDGLGKVMREAREQEEEEPK